MEVEEIMVKKIEYIEPGATVYDAIEKMIDKRIRSLLVKLKDKKDVYGVITVRDIVFKVIGKDLDPNKVKVEEIASKPLVCVDKDMSIEHVIKLMEKSNIARVFVSEEGEILGVVALLDVMAGSLIKRVREGWIA
ncbi:MAG: histidine kinase [Syntrophobacter sp. DG_60]|nr:MAG: histidine kinase [Syntrophobacter sp. DG_60]